MKGFLDKKGQRKYLIVTEKNIPNNNNKDGGHFVVETLKKHLNGSVDLLHFSSANNKESHSCFVYKYPDEDKFSRRLKNGVFIKEQIKNIVNQYTDIIFIHVSMFFGFEEKIKNVETWIFPMFLSSSYIKSTYEITDEYIRKEQIALSISDYIITPSFCEAKQLMFNFNINRNKIKIIPRGIENENFSQKHKREIKDKPFYYYICSIASIKPQKNTIELIELFHSILKTNQNSFLKIIGPVQDGSYHEKVISEITKRGISNNIEFLGHVPQNQLAKTLKPIHIHLFPSLCETYGRVVFETLSLGIINICSKKDNASFEYLENHPFVIYYDNKSTISNIVNNVINDYQKLSEMAKTTLSIYSDNILGKVVSAEISKKRAMIISDFDGTLFIKDNTNKTLENIKVFNKYNCKVICTSRSLDYLKHKVTELNIDVDFIISWSGSVISNKKNELIHIEEIKNSSELNNLTPVKFENKVIQFISKNSNNISLPIQYRTETYNNTTYISNWNTTKLSGIMKLLKIINWSGRIVAFGDSKYDYEYLRIFDGFLIKTNKDNDDRFKIINKLHYDE